VIHSISFRNPITCRKRPCHTFRQFVAFCYRSLASFSRHKHGICVGERLR